MRIIEKRAVLISTLGTEPQVVTAVLDLLLQQDEQIERVVVLHTVSSAPSISEAVTTLHDVFQEAPYKNKIILKTIPISDEKGIPLTDVATLSATRSAFQELYRQVQSAKQANLKVHLCIAGGRKNLAVFGMISAQMLFDGDDRLWHLYSGGEYLESKRLHPQPEDDIHLIPIPVILWSYISPVFTYLGEIDDPFQAVERIRELQLAEKIELARTFVLGSLTPGERRVVKQLVLGGLSDQKLAEQLHLSPRTVEQHLRSVYLKAASHWVLENVNRTQLIALLNLYYSTKIRENPHDK